jgi:hypothetical protein
MAKKKKVKLTREQKNERNKKCREYL